MLRSSNEGGAKMLRKTLETNQEKGENNTPRRRWMVEVESDVSIMG
jgi:hypothetical protein